MTSQCGNWIRRRGRIAIGLGGRSKSLWTAVAVLFAVFLTAVSAVAGQKCQSAPELGDQVVVYYFHSTYRCETCLFIEEVSGDSLKELYPDQLRGGRLLWQSLNMDLPENRAVASKFALSSNTLLVARLAKGDIVSWRKIDDLWELAQKPDQLIARLSAAVDELLK